MDILQEYKNKNELNSSEEIFGIIKPPNFQCPNIDKIIKSIREIDDYCYKGRKNCLETEVLFECVEDVENEIQGLEDKLEDLRIACDNLRS